MGHMGLEIQMYTHLGPHTGKNNILHFWDQEAWHHIHVIWRVKKHKQSGDQAGNKPTVYPNYIKQFVMVVPKIWITENVSINLSWFRKSATVSTAGKSWTRHRGKSLQQTNC